MAKIAFDIKYRQEIESGEYKPILECDIEAIILSWNVGGEYPIVCMAKKDDGIPFRVNNEGFPMETDKSRLFLSKKPVLTEFERQYSEFRYGCEATDYFDSEALEKVKKEWAYLLENARKQLQPEIDAEIDKAYKNSDAVQYRRGKEDALKNMPHWKHMYAGAAGSGDGRNIYLIRDGIDSYRLSPVIAGGNDFLVLPELDKLPKM